MNVFCVIAAVAEAALSGRDGGLYVGRYGPASWHQLAAL